MNPRRNITTCGVFVAAIAYACAQGTPTPEPSSLLLARVLEVTLASPQTPETIYRVATLVRSHLPVDSEVSLITIEFATPSTDPGAFSSRVIVHNSQVIVFHVDSLPRATTAPVAAGQLASSVVQGAGIPKPILSYRVDVAGQSDRAKARVLQAWLKGTLALYPDLDSVRVHFRGTQTQRGGITIATGASTISAAAK